MRWIGQCAGRNAAAEAPSRRLRPYFLILVGWCAFLLSGPPALGLEALDLPRAIQYALLQNRELIQTRLSIDISMYALDAAEAEFSFEIRPEGNAVASESRDAYTAGLNVDKKIAVGTEFGAGIRYSLAEGEGEPAERSSVRFRVSQPLLREFGALVNREPVVQAENDVQTVRRFLERQKSSLVVAVVRSFEDLVRLKRQIESDEASFVRADNLYRLTVARERQGRATRIDVLRVDLQRGQAESRLENNREQYASRFKDFADLLGFDADAEFELVPSEPLELDVPSEQESIAIAFSNRLEYAQALQQLDDARRGVAIARRNLWPSLQLVGQVEQAGEGDSFSDASRMNETLWTIGVEGDTDLVQSRDRAFLGQRTVDQESAVQQIQIVTNEITREVGQRMLAYERARRELKIAEGNLHVTVDRVRLSRRLFQVGRGDNFSVTDAEDAFVQAERQFLVARADASIVAYELLDRLGTLLAVPPDLKPDAEAQP